MKGLSDELRQEVNLELLATAQDAVARAVRVVPVDTGFLKGSIQYTPTTANGSHEISAPIVYAPYVEFGTGSGFIPPSDPDITALAALFRGKGIRQVNNRAQPYLIPFIYAEWEQFLKRIDKIKLQ